MPIDPMARHRFLIAARGALLALLLATGMPCVGHAQPLTVFAAASLTEALQDIAALWTKAGHPGPRLSFGASSMLARQIEQGAPANVFASADETWADYLAARNLLAPGTRRSLLGNSVVLIVPAGRPRSLQLDASLDIAALLGPSGRLATGDPRHVPVGLYAEQALRRLGLWDRIAARLARTEDVRSALLLVERGEAPAGIVYATDAAASKGVTVAATFPPDSHDPVSYPFAVTRAGDTPDARAFLDFLSSPEARQAFTRRGFLTR